MAPKRYDKWITKRSLPEGGQAHTYLVYKEGDTQKHFALKRLKNLNRISRFRQELEAGLRLSHPNVLKVEAYNLEHETPYIVTEYCSCGPLSRSDMMQYSVLERLRVFAAICQGIAHAHKNNVIHRDLKPDNIFLHDRMTPVVGDFGLCFLTDEGERITLSDEAVGSRFYTAPEVEAGRVDDVKPASDVYSLGKVLYWMMTQRHLPREDFRIPEFDLTHNYPDQVEYFLINELLDRMLVTDLTVRYHNAIEVAWVIDEPLIRRIETHGRPTDLTAPLRCMFCSLGFYKPIVDKVNEVSKDAQSHKMLQNLGLNPTGGTWLILECDNCGNIQLFRADLAKIREAWKGR